MKKTIENLVKQALLSVGAPDTKFTVEHPTNLAFGDYSTNAGIVSKKAEEILEYINTNLPEGVEKAEIKSGFINFYLTKEFFKKSVGEIIKEGENFGRNENLKGQKTIVEYTDPNPFKEFHIGHFMSNAIGESIARIFEWNGAEVKRACYQGDVGMHVAKAVWGMMRGEENAYASGSKAFEENEEAKQEIIEINKKIYSKDSSVLDLYTKGRRESLDEFEKIYQRLDTKFDFNFFESETAEFGKQIVEENTPKVFEKGDGGAIIFNAEKFDKHLHTRVFINSEGLPTYEAKELGLAKIKFEKYPYDKSVVVTANEINDYFKVLLCALGQIYPELAEKTKHISHGIMKLPTGKMSSRTGDVITAEALIEDVREKVKGNEAVAIGAIKYMILRQSIGNDIIFDLEKSVSTEGDSGVYLQYAYARTTSLLEKAKNQGVSLDKTGDNTNQGISLENRETHEVEKLLYRFPEIVERAGIDFSPNILVTYLTELAGSFNNFYAHEQVINDSPESPYRIAVVEAFRTVIKNGLNILGIPAPERM
jgi:arginyl-tRNA synthetase